MAYNGQEMMVTAFLLLHAGLAGGDLFVFAAAICMCAQG
jgi:hypothetical protein